MDKYSQFINELGTAFPISRHDHIEYVVLTADVDGWVRTFKFRTRSELFAWIPTSDVKYIKVTGDKYNREFMLA